MLLIHSCSRSSYVIYHWRFLFYFSTGRAKQGLSHYRRLTLPGKTSTSAASTTGETFTSYPAATVRSSTFSFLFWHSLLHQNRMFVLNLNVGSILLFFLVSNSITLSYQCSFAWNQIFRVRLLEGWCFFGVLLASNPIICF